VPVGPAKFDLNRCNESPLRGERPDFWPVSKNNTGIFPLRGNPAGNNSDELSRRYNGLYLVLTVLGHGWISLD